MAKKKVKKNEPGDMFQQIQNSSKRNERRDAKAEADYKNQFKIKNEDVSTAFRKVQRKYVTEPAQNEKKNNLFKKRAAAAASGAGMDNNTFSGGLLGQYQFKAFMRYYQAYWDDGDRDPRDRLDAILENGGFDTLQQAWDEFVTDPESVDAMAVMQSLAENNGQLPDTEEEWVADLLADYDPDYIPGTFIRLVPVKMP